MLTEENIMKLSFLNNPNPHLVAMIQKNNPDEAINIVRNSIYDGATAFGLQAECLKPEFQNVQSVQSIMTHMGERPVYLTNYRYNNNTGKTDDRLADELAEYAKGGVTLLDVMGDMFCPSKDEIALDEKAIDKQKALIERIHENGGEVLMSSHTMRFMSGEEVLELVMKQKERGADVAKIVTAANSEDEELENLRTTQLLKKELGIPFLFLSGGTHCKKHRMLGPVFGCSMYLCVQDHYCGSTKTQPILKAVKNVLDNFDWKPDRKFN